MNDRRFFFQSVTQSYFRLVRFGCSTTELQETSGNWAIRLGSWDKTSYYCNQRTSYVLLLLGELRFYFSEYTYVTNWTKIHVPFIHKA